MNGLDGRVAVVTGAGSGIGAAVALAFAAAGAAVVAVDHDGEGLARTAASASQEIELQVADVTDRDAVHRLVSEVIGARGRLDVMANVAGIMVRRPALELEPEELEAVIDVNVRGLLWCCQAAGRVMAAAGTGVIVNASSTASVVAGPGLAAYAMSKGAVSALTRVLAAELGPTGVRVNAVAPGYTLTAMTESAWTVGDEVDDTQRQRVLSGVARATPLRRAATPDEVAGTFVWLASESASYVTGQVIHANGGVHMAG